MTQKPSHPAGSAIDWVTRAACARRFHTHNVQRQETIGHHSHGVACLVQLLHPGCRKELLVAALYHDLAEGEYGDIPGHTKRVLGIREQVAKLEDEELIRHGIGMPALTEQEGCHLKFADSAHGALYCLEELRRGNVDLLAPLQNFVEWLQDYGCTNDAELTLLGWIKKEEELYVYHEKHRRHGD